MKSRNKVHYLRIFSSLNYLSYNKTSNKQAQNHSQKDINGMGVLKEKKSEKRKLKQGQ